MSVYEKRRLRKSRSLEELKTVFGEAKKIMVVGIEGVETPATQRVRVKLKGKARLLVVKNTIASKAIEGTTIAPKYRENLKQMLSGPNGIVFTEENLFQIASVLNAERTKAYLKPGRVTPTDVTIPAGVTTIQPGPLSESLTAFGVPFEIKKNLVYITKDTLVAKAGEKVNSRLCTLLRALSVTPVESGFRLKLGYDDGLLIPGTLLEQDLSAYRLQAAHAAADALSLAYNAAIPTPETAPMLITKAYQEALALSVEAGYVTGETAQPVLAKAFAIAQYLSNL
ncbi:MAG: 50S ribosomal protein L10 [Candidatus Marsarchaeota archaeon]|nr:50S ribosomal protein L10 [Candidatus Marsarchaeota archaeon]